VNSSTIYRTRFNERTIEIFNKVINIGFAMNLKATQMRRMKLGRSAGKKIFQSLTKAGFFNMGAICLQLHG